MAQSRKCLGYLQPSYAAHLYRREVDVPVVIDTDNPGHSYYLSGILGIAEIVLSAFAKKSHARADAVDQQDRAEAV